MPLAAGFPFSTNLPFGPAAHAKLPAAVTNIPTHGMVGPMVRVVVPPPEADRHVSLVWFDSWGDAFSLLVGGPGFKQPTNAWCLELAAGIYYVENGEAARDAKWRFERRREGKTNGP
jgi:hypothetical protein